MTKHLLGLVALAGSAMLAACGPAAPEVNAPADIAAVNTLRTTFLTAFNSGDAAGVAATYTANGTSSGNHEATVTGHDAILAAQKAQFDQMTAKLDLMPDETMTFGTMGHDYGRYKITMTMKAGGATMSDEGHYVVLLEKQADGSWKVAHDIDNSSMPMPPPPAPAAPPAKGRGK